MRGRAAKHDIAKERHSLAMALRQLDLEQTGKSCLHMAMSVGRSVGHSLTHSLTYLLLLLRWPGKCQWEVVAAPNRTEGRD